MILRRIKNMFKQAFEGMSRNKNMGFMCVLSIVLVLLILGTVLLVALNANHIVDISKENLDEVIVYINDEATDEQVTALENKLMKTDHIKNLKYESKEDALAFMKNQLANSDFTLEGIEEEGNPFPASYIITVDDIKNVDSIVKSLEGDQAVKKVSYFGNVISKMEKVSETIRWGGLAFIAALLVSSIFLISTTIKLTVMNRQREISIMKDVGCTNGDIRGPFVIEGIALGLIASLISSFIIYYTYIYMYGAANSNMGMILSMSMIDPMMVIKDIVMIFVAVGVGIGALGSMISLKKFLKV